MASHELFRPTRIPLMGTPLKQSSSETKSVLELSSRGAFGHIHQNSKDTSTNNDDEGTPDLSFDDRTSRPRFERHEETTNIELFYDLFFVANLTTFSSVHEINDRKTLSSYIGFFCVLWFTWCQVTLFDVRFVAESIVDRAAKAAHLGVMVGLAVVGPNFNPTDYEQDVMRTMSLILMVSRFILAIQYLLVLIQVWKYKQTKTPLALVAGSNFAAACIYLGITFSFHDDRSYGYRAFYAIPIVEIAFNIAISSNWKVLSFKGTHLVQRMSLLTLIILGEGVIVVCKNISKIVKNKNAWDGPTIGTIVAAIAIVYFLYMLYFDTLPSHHFGSIRQQIWAFLHFPFHLTLVLTMEGMAQFVLWHKMVAVSRSFNRTVQGAQIRDIYNNNPTAIPAALKPMIEELFQSYPPANPKTFTEVESGLGILGMGYDSNNATSVNDYQTIFGDVVSAVVHSVFTSYGFETPEAKPGQEASRTGTEELNRDDEVIGLVFVYFFVAAGITLMLMGFLNFLTLPREQFTRSGLKHPAILGRFGTYIYIGLGLALLSIAISYDAGSTLASSAWLLPLVCFCILVVQGVQYVRWPSWLKKR
ncbi:hypothetical protein WAI453_003030 [Rhynchosporium graminicola]|uniref:Low temperature requirement A n=1 Tax=Rhynchosporium graminicola TaxID=2792576 RepID=A0A1E1LNQ4_9HELO|nr:uncharacterized protein RCO7_11153 [Rhynchosporium commune]